MEKVEAKHSKVFNLQIDLVSMNYQINLEPRKLLTKFCWKLLVLYLGTPLVITLDLVSCVVWCAG